MQHDVILRVTRSDLPVLAMNEVINTAEIRVGKYLGNTELFQRIGVS